MEASLHTAIMVLGISKVFGEFQINGHQIRIDPCWWSSAGNAIFSCIDRKLDRKEKLWPHLASHQWFDSICLLHYGIWKYRPRTFQLVPSSKGIPNCDKTKNDHIQFDKKCTTVHNTLHECAHTNITYTGKLKNLWFEDEDLTPN